MRPNRTNPTPPAAAPQPRSLIAPPGQIVIGEARYIVTHLQTSDGVELASRCANLLAPMVAGLRAGKGGSFMNAISFALQSQALGSNVKDIAYTLAGVTQVQLPDGKSHTLSDVYEVHFAGKYDAWYAWLRFALEYTMSSFLGILPALVEAAVGAFGAAGEKDKSPSIPPSPAE